MRHFRPKSSSPVPIPVLVYSNFYTSEGCSSCPPADKWISKLKSHPGLWTSIVPVGFHVDYWNYIGWKDRFSSPEYSARQKRYAHSKSIKTVYTPGFLLNGEEWRSFFGLRKISTETDEEVGSLKLKINDVDLVVEFTPTEKMTDKTLILNVAVLGFDIKTEVQSGENRNKELKHNFTVLGYKTIPLYKNKSAYVVMTELPDIVETAPRMAVSVWVNKENDMTPIQAAGGWLD
ncbi:MAG: DUF1223 domain-containing protein [Proteobacteria bacterium]|nr:DUF1223 domain-containing protein [Pseudomonadota bacterium]